MARPVKFKLDYFPLDISFFTDHKVLSLDEAYPGRGTLFAVQMMAFIYSDHGYYLEFPEGFQFSLAKRIGNGLTGAVVMEMVNKAFEVKLFSREQFEMNSIITSAGIQKRWYKIQKDSKRNIEINPDFWLVEKPEETAKKVVSSEETLVNSEETGVSTEESAANDTITTQMKLNEIKLNNSNSMKGGVGENIPEIGGSASQPTDRKKNVDPGLSQKQDSQDAGAKNLPKRSRSAIARAKFVAPTYQEVLAYVDELRGKSGKCPPEQQWEPDRIRMEAGDIFDHYDGIGWVQGKNKVEIVSWQAAVRKCVRNAAQKYQSRPNFEDNIASKPITSKKPEAAKIEEKRPKQEHEELSYLFSRFLEGQCSTISIESKHWKMVEPIIDQKFMACKAGVIAEAKKKADDHLIQHKIPEADRGKFERKYAVLESFQVFADQNYNPVNYAQ